MRRPLLLTFFLSCLISVYGPPRSLCAQENPAQIIIREDGIMRWKADSSEITGFGVNYTVPFAHAYRTGKRMGVDLKEAIDQDVYHFARLGLDLFRVHVWDCEISDTLGNLIDNEHLELFDYLLSKLQERGINAVITPIAYWGNGWPEPDEPTPGFSTKYGKQNCLTDPAAIKAQENYLGQFIRHVNRYTGIAYKDDPMILAFEICNEPHHRGSPEDVTVFIRRMKDAIRSTGCTKPIFYNITHSIHLAEAYFDAGIDGGTFQWYPTGLGFQKELGGNMLPNVDRYTIPFDDILKKNGAARFVYEFDAADMASSYIYPAMARSFRTAGMQLATHFSYDPAFLAPFNTEYNTHYMNLVYAPQKALSLMICAEVFRNIPLYSDYGVYPDNTSFGPFRVSYEDDLAEMVTEEKFIYTNNTSTRINSPEKLKLIAGYGNSALIEYDGTGAYFLDNLGDGIWRIELMPDAIVVDNLFGQNQIGKTRAVIKQARRKMKLNLPGFEEGFIIESVDWNDSIIYKETRSRTIDIKPGVYLIMNMKYKENDSVELRSNRQIEMENIPPSPPDLDSVHVYYQSVTPWIAGQDHKIKARIVSPEMPKKVVLRFIQAEKAINLSIPMVQTSPYMYEAVIPGKYLVKDNLVYQYHFAVHLDSVIFYSPANKEYKEEQFSWSGFHHGTNLAIGHSEYPFYLFDALMHYKRLNRQWLPSYNISPGEKEPNYIHIKIDRLTTQDPENLNSAPIANYTIRHFFADIIEGREEEMLDKEVLVLKAQASEGRTFPVQIALVMKDGSTFGHSFDVNGDDQLYYTLLSDFKPVNSVLLPRPYPTFLPYFSAARKSDKLDLGQIESLQISIGPGIKEADWNKIYELMISGVWLE